MYGCVRSQLAIKGGKRVSSATAYLHETGALKRANLHVKCGVQVTRIVLEGRPPRAVAVEYQTTNAPTSVRKYVLAQREIIVSAGTVQSPQLLQLSGIGDKEQLAEVDIECRVHLPGVGRNLQDHLFVPLIQVASKDLTMDVKGLDKLLLLVRYLLTKGGPVSSQALESMAFLDSSSIAVTGELQPPASPDLNPDLQLHFVCAGGFNETANLNLGYPADHNKDIQRGFATLPTLLHPKSIGYVRLASSDPFAPPKVVPNYLSHPDDLEVLVRGLKLARRIHAAFAFEDYRANEIIDPEIAAKHHPHSDEYLREFVRKKAVTVYHPVGTCKIGPPSDPLAVVDPQLRVYGCLGLRVVDCSIFPKLMGGNTYAPAIMVGEKAADMIKNSPLLPPAHPSLPKPQAKL